jgi:transposase
MTEQNVKRNENQTIRGIFNEATDLSKVMIVGLDYAERTHKAVLCDGHGDICLKPFSIRNDTDGLAYLNERITTQIKKRGIRIEHVIIGGETPGSWAQNFVSNLVAGGHTVIDLHAKKVKKYRENETTDNDTLSAETICRMLIDKDGRQRIYEGIYKELKETSRTRTRLVRKRTRVSNQLHTCVDTYFPGLLDGKLSGLVPFGKPSLFVLAEHSLDSIRRCRHQSLTAKLAKNGSQDASHVAMKLKQLAAKALHPTEAEERARRLEIDFLVAQYRLLNEQVNVCKKRVAELLRQTPGCLLTTLPGVGVTFASQLVAELGPPETIRALKYVILD